LGGAGKYMKHAILIGILFMAFFVTTGEFCCSEESGPPRGNSTIAEPTEGVVEEADDEEKSAEHYIRLAERYYEDRYFKKTERILNVVLHRATLTREQKEKIHEYLRKITIYKETYPYYYR